MPGISSKILIPREMLAFNEELKKIQETYSAGRYFTLKEGQKTDRSRKEDYRVPFTQLYQPCFELDRLYQALIEISSLVSKHRPEVKTEVERILALPQSTLKGVLEAVVNGNLDTSLTVSETQDLNTYILKFIVLNTIKPFLKAFAGTISGKARVDLWGESFCPICGNRPYIGRLAKEDGKRHLRCSLCDTEWLYKRLACYNCGNENHDSLSFLLVEETPGYQIDVCEVCKSYLKVIDERTSFDPEFAWDDVHTVYLDLIAQQKGYSNQYKNT